LLQVLLNLLDQPLISPILLLMIFLLSLYSVLYGNYSTWYAHGTKKRLWITAQFFVCLYMLYCTSMNKNEMLKELLDTKRTELIWALSLQDYTQEDIAYILRDADRSTIARTINKKPEDWQPKWVKRS